MKTPTSKVDKDMMAQLLGTKDKYIPQAMPPKQILSMVKYADESVSRQVLGGASKEHTMLRESYDFLCEFAHPNFHSNKIAFDLDKVGSRFVLRYREPMHDDEFGLSATCSYLLRYISICMMRSTRCCQPTGSKNRWTATG